MKNKQPKPQTEKTPQELDLLKGGEMGANFEIQLTSLPPAPASQCTNSCQNCRKQK